MSMKIQSLTDYLHTTDTKIRDTQAELDDLEMFGGTPERESQLRNQLAELHNKKARHARSIEHAELRESARLCTTAGQIHAITLEKGDTIQASRDGGWGRLHYVSHAIGPRKLERDFWICSGCRTEIIKGQEHYRRSYYADKRDKRSGHQVRLCLHCHENHNEQHPCNTMFPVYRPARRKAA